MDKALASLVILCALSLQIVQQTVGTSHPPAGGGAIAVTLICKKASANCVVTSTVPVGGFVSFCQLAETAAPLTAPHDSGSNTYTLDKNQDNSGGAGVDVSCYHSVLTNQLTSGSSTVTWGASYNQYFAVVITNLATGAFDVAAAANQTGTTAFNAGATAATAATDACLGVSGNETSATLAAAGGATLIDSGSTTINDTRALGVEWLQVATSAYTAQGTMSATVNGIMMGVCYK